MGQTEETEKTGERNSPGNLLHTLTLQNLMVRAAYKLLAWKPNRNSHIMVPNSRTTRDLLLKTFATVSALKLFEGQHTFVHLSALRLFEGQHTLCTFPLTLTVQVNSNPPWAVRNPRPLSEQVPVCINRQLALRNFQRPFAPISFLCLLKKPKALGTIRRFLNTRLGCTHSKKL